MTAKNIFKPANILIPKNIDQGYSVVACDQYTSEPQYWDEVKKIVEDKSSTLHMVFPEIYLKTADFDETIKSINDTMSSYLAQDIFKEYANSIFYVERKLKNSHIRKGLVGMIDLEGYDYSVSSQSPIRATEGTVLERIPPRVKIRENAPLELPHVMLLIDDENKSIIEPLEGKKAEFEQVYSVELMQQSGSIKGYKLDQASCDSILKSFDKIGSSSQLAGKEPLLFAVGDGNHSLATAKKCYMNLKEEIGSDKALQSSARYALVEIVNLHDNSLEFEAIHRVMFNISPNDVIDELGKKYILSDTYTPKSQRIDIVTAYAAKTVYITNPTLNLAVGSLQAFIDGYISKNGGEVDYIHGDDVVKSLCDNDTTIGFILPCMDKNDLFKTVILDGALPRKTFSMGEACDKRFYLEARKIEG